MRLDGKTALVTGSTSGIGRAIAAAQARRGADVIVSGRDELRGAEVVAEVEASGGSARFVQADLTAGRAADARAIAAAAVFLASDDADYIHGATLVVDGGRVAS